MWVGNAMIDDVFPEKMESLMSTEYALRSRQLDLLHPRKLDMFRHSEFKRRTCDPIILADTNNQVDIISRYRGS
jgi:hypothetical protein